MSNAPLTDFGADNLSNLCTFAIEKKTTPAIIKSMTRLILLALSFWITVSGAVFADSYLTTPNNKRLYKWDGQYLQTTSNNRLYKWDGTYILSTSNKRLYKWDGTYLLSTSNKRLYKWDRSYVLSTNNQRLYKIHSPYITTPSNKRLYKIDGQFPIPILIALTTGLL